MVSYWIRTVGLCAGLGVFLCLGCESDTPSRAGGTTTPSTPDSDSETESATAPRVDDSATGSGIISFGDSSSDSAESTVTCADAAASRTYIGCEFWPTVTYNMVWYDFSRDVGFSFAVVISNDTPLEATVTVEGGALDSPLTDTVPAHAVKAIPLPWVPQLKGTTFNAANTSGNRVSASVLVPSGAYHMTTSVPVTAWQFSPLEYEISPVPTGCIDNLTDPTRCFSVTNDASLLLPTHALTGTYRVFSYGGSFPDTFGDAPGAIAVTATEDRTLLKVQLTADVVAGDGVASASAGETMEVVLNRGDVVQLLAAPGKWMGEPHQDLTGSLVVGFDADDPGTSDAPHYKPVQVIGLSPIVDLTPTTQESFADHTEETVFPAEALGHTYVVVAPTGPSQSGVRHKVRIIGNVDGTTLSYTPSAPAGAPTALDAGQWAEIETTEGFVISSQDGDHPFLVVSYIQAAEPAASVMVTPDQFRAMYDFLAPTSYDDNFATITAPTGTAVHMDGTLLDGATPVPGTQWEVYRVRLMDTSGGTHHLEADAPVGLQVTGYGWATSYYYPGGLDVNIISEPPILILL